MTRGAAVPFVVICAFSIIASFDGRGAERQNLQPGGDGDRLVLITLDGARTEEMFGGLDLAILKSTLKEGQSLERHATYRRFWADTPQERRRKLMPFFWGTLMTAHGSIAGHRALGSVASLTNRHRFSYPGYSEILVGRAHDDLIKSNDPIRNPNATVLEVLCERLALPRDRVATFASWGVFNYIVERAEGATTVDAGPDEPLPQDPQVKDLALLQRETLPPWDNVRSDIFTFRLAMRHFASARPRVVYLAFDETDDWAHDGRYDRLLDAYARTDRYLEQLWTWLQAQPDYRGRTHLLITTDHGRGHTAADWRDHGAKIAGADQVWMAFASPQMKQRGEWRGHAPITTSQIAATVARWMGVDYRAVQPDAGAPIESGRVPPM
jgi:hypothetical protein